LAAQVEVRSPYLDYRLVEYAARLPHCFKIGDPSSPMQNKYLPKIYYHRYVPQEIAWAEKKGMGMNLQWGKKIVNDIHYRQAFESAYRSLEQTGIASGEFRKAWEAYCQGNRQFAGVMMAGFMLYQWRARTLPGESQIPTAGNLSCRIHSKAGECL
jgi:asparagine synthase (glutamine-hydrolysing)